MQKIVVLIYFMVFTSGCRLFSLPVSSAKSVQIEQSPVKNQGKQNFCWAYTFTSMVEAESLRLGMLDVELSPEYIVFYRAYSLLKDQLAISMLPEQMAQSSFDGGFTAAAASAASNYGLVPASVFNGKFEFDSMDFSERIHKWILENITDSNRALYFSRNPEELRVSLSSALDIKIPGPYDKFLFRGQEYTPVTFAKEKLKFDPIQYESVVINEQNVEKVLEFIKKSLLLGHTVPLEVSVLGNEFQNSDPFSFDTSRCSKEHPCRITSAHDILAVDFETEESGFGLSQSASSIKAGTKPIKRLLVKNSWGAGRGVRQDGGTADGNNGGYYFVTSEYLNPPDEILVPGEKKYLNTEIYVQKRILEGN